MANNAKMTIKSNVTAVMKVCNDALERGLEACGMEAVDMTHRLEPKYGGRGTPVDTGRLRNSIAWATINNQNFDYYYTDDNGIGYSDHARGGMKAGTVVIGTNVEYARIIEEGTASRPAYHYLRNALVDGQDRYERIIKASLKAAQV